MTENTDTNGFNGCRLKHSPTDGLLTDLIANALRELKEAMLDGE
ncbi:hypothetical protein [Haloarcula sp. S1AR25-4]|nr:hypothetical protein [Halomicroarcula sp. S1AR25-4]